MNDTMTKFETVMLIDDNNIDLYVTSRIILKNDFGNKILQYTCAQEALRYLSDHQHDLKALPQVILVDIYMPGMSGFDFMEAYDGFSDALKKHCRAYIISSSIDESDISRARSDKNVVAFEEKPVTAAFLQRVASQL